MCLKHLAAPQRRGIKKYFLCIQGFYALPKHFRGKGYIRALQSILWGSGLGVFGWLRNPMLIRAPNIN